MRIISQRSHADLPYERTTLCLDGVLVTARCDEKQYLMGKYSTEEKAVKAMKMCREQYAQCEINKHLIQKAADNLEGVSITFTGEVRNQLADKYLFQFPADDEI